VVATEEDLTVVFGVAIEEFEGGFHGILCSNRHNQVNLVKNYDNSKKRRNGVTAQRHNGSMALRYKVAYAVRNFDVGPEQKIADCLKLV